MSLHRAYVPQHQHKFIRVVGHLCFLILWFLWWDCQEGHSFQYVYLHLSNRSWTKGLHKCPKQYSVGNFWSNSIQTLSFQSSLEGCIPCLFQSEQMWSRWRLVSILSLIKSICIIRWYELMRMLINIIEAESIIFRWQCSSGACTCFPVSWTKDIIIFGENTVWTQVNLSWNQVWIC